MTFFDSQLLFYAIVLTFIGFLILQNLYFHRKAKFLSLNIKDLEADVTVQRSKNDTLNREIEHLRTDLLRAQKNPDVIRVLSDLNKNGTVLRVERIDPDTVFQWSPGSGVRN
jgi:cell division protein FtsL